MKKTISGVLIILVLLFTGCDSKAKNVNYAPDEVEKEDKNQVQAELKKETFKIGWEFREVTKKEGKDKDGNDLEYPFTEVYLVLGHINGEKIKIGSYMGSAVEIKDFENRPFPKDSIIGCQCWYAGAGDDLVVVREGNSLQVKWRSIYEVVEEEGHDIKLDDFKVVKKIEIPEGSIVMPINEKDEKSIR